MSETKVLATYVHVLHPDTGANVVLEPGQELPAWAEELVTNPDCFSQPDDDHDSDPDDLDDPGDQGDQGDQGESSGQEGEHDSDPGELDGQDGQGESSGQEGEDEQVVAPPKAGPGSSAAAWRTYAAANGVLVEDDATRDAVIAALAAAGVNTGD